MNRGSHETIGRSAMAVSVMAREVQCRIEIQSH